MKTLMIFAVVLGLSLANNPDQEEFEPSFKYSDQKYLCAAIDCFLGEATCDANTESIKHSIQEAFNTACAKCSPEQKRNVKNFFHNAEINCPTRTRLFLQTYDKDGNLRYAFWEALKHA
uniref:Chemosensory protein n=1 Tax=Histia rhodope TaxID=1453155 RepID=A0A6M9BN01_9NEOP|nr:chemosensory protein [Histia rhodope]